MKHYTPKYLATLAGLLLAFQAYAQTPEELAAAKARYKQEIAACKAGNPVAGNSNCAREARNTLAEFRRGRMNESLLASDFTRNALQRCEVHQGDDKADCIARIRGQGRVQGSVAGGGILRELTTRKVINASVAPRETPKAPEGPLPSGLMSNCKWVPPTDWVCK